jgi:hypothetical protein
LCGSKWIGDEGDEHAGREEARQLEAQNPLWIVIFGVYSGEFVCFPRFGPDGGSIVAAKDPCTLPPRMRKAENSAASTHATSNGRMNSPAAPPSPEKRRRTHD